MPIMPARLGGRPAEAITEAPRRGPSEKVAATPRARVDADEGAAADLADRARTGAATRAAAAEMVMEAILVVVVCTGKVRVARDASRGRFASVGVGAGLGAEAENRGKKISARRDPKKRMRNEPLSENRRLVRLSKRAFSNFDDCTLVCKISQ